MHDQRVNESQFGVHESRWQGSDDIKAISQPCLHRARIAGNNEIELHGPISPGLRMVERVFQHGPANARALGALGADIAAVGNMVAAAALVGTDEIGPEYRAAALRNKHLVVAAEPKGKGIFPGDIARNWIGKAGAKCWFQDRPDCVFIAGLGWSGSVHLILP